VTENETLSTKCLVLRTCECHTGPNSVDISTLVFLFWPENALPKVLYERACHYDAKSLVWQKI
jgi:hypothetical protein